MRALRYILSVGGLFLVALTFVFSPLLFSTRALSDEEKSVAATVFVGSVDLDRVRLKAGGPLTWTGAGVTIGNVISFPKRKYDATQSAYPWLVHELTHVWQYQNHGLGYIPRSVWEQLSEPEAYVVEYDAAKSFMEYDVEEQAVLVADYFMRQDQRYEPYILELRGEKQ